MTLTAQVVAVHAREGIASVRMPGDSSTFTRMQLHGLKTLAIKSESEPWLDFIHRLANTNRVGPEVIAKFAELVATGMQESTAASEAIAFAWKG